MSSSMQEWVERLSAKPLPAMRQTLSRARDLLDASNTNHSVLGEVVARDPGFSLYLLRSLNSLPKGPREPVSNIPNAISLLGMAAIERAIHDLPTLDGGSTESAKLGLAECYSRAAHAGIYAAGLAKWRGQAGQQAFATAALLHDVGEMALWAHTPQVMNKIQRLIALGGGREDAAVQVLGFTLEELNRQLGSRWRLPALAQESQGIFNSYKPQPLTVMLACAVARASAFDWQNRELLDLLELLAELLELPLDQVQSQLHQYAAHAARELQPLEFPLPAFRLVLAPSKEIRTTTSEPDRQPQGKAGTNRPIAGVTPDRQTSSQSRPAQEDQTNPLHTQLMRAFRDMQQHHGLRSVMFAMLSPDKTRLKARFVAGVKAATTDYRISTPT